MIELTASDGAKIGAYKTDPGMEPRGAVIVIQEIFGVNHHIRSIADRISVAGYTVLAPAIFDRAERGIELAYDDDAVSRGMALAKKISPEEHARSIDAAIAYLDGAGPVGIVGFCLGGTLAFAAAARDESLSAAVCFYGGGIADLVPAKLKCPTELHFGENDQSISLQSIEKIKKAQPDLPIYTYPGAGHGFNCDERASYDKTSADLAWSRTLAFLEANMHAR